MIGMLLQRHSQSQISRCSCLVALAACYILLTPALAQTTGSEAHWQPTGYPSAQPSRSPTSEPTGPPTSRPSAKPSRAPSATPSSFPSSQPSSHPTRPAKRRCNTYVSTVFGDGQAASTDSPGLADQGGNGLIRKLNLADPQYPVKSVFTSVNGDFFTFLALGFSGDAIYTSSLANNIKVLNRSLELSNNRVASSLISGSLGASTCYRFVVNSGNAGQPPCFGDQDGAGTFARFNQISSVAVWMDLTTGADKLLFLTDTANNKIKSVDLAPGGSYLASTFDTNVDTKAMNLQGVAINQNASTLYVTVYGAIYSYNIPIGRSSKTLLVGQLGYNFGYQIQGRLMDGPLSSAHIGVPRYVTIDGNGDLYISDTLITILDVDGNPRVLSSGMSAGNYDSIRVISFVNQNITTIAGKTYCGSLNDDSQDSGLCFTPGLGPLPGSTTQFKGQVGLAISSKGAEMYVADTYDNVIRHVYCEVVDPLLEPLNLASGVIPTPSQSPTVAPSQPTCVPSNKPSNCPTTSKPTAKPSTLLPSRIPSMLPTFRPTRSPTLLPSQKPTISPSCVGYTVQPSTNPSRLPTVVPSFDPTAGPTLCPSVQPSKTPSMFPTAVPSVDPTVGLTLCPSVQPSTVTSALPTAVPTPCPSVQPSTVASALPTAVPSVDPTAGPTLCPSVQPSKTPSMFPTTVPSVDPTVGLTLCPSAVPSDNPSLNPSAKTSSTPSIPSIEPTTLIPTTPAAYPTLGLLPSNCPSALQKSIVPTFQAMTPPSLPISSPTALVPASYVLMYGYQILAGLGAEPAFCSKGEYVVSFSQAIERALASAPMPKVNVTRCVFLNGGLGRRVLFSPTEIDLLAKANLVKVFFTLSVVAPPQGTTRSGYLSQLNHTLSANAKSAFASTNLSNVVSPVSGNLSWSLFPIDGTGTGSVFLLSTAPPSTRMFATSLRPASVHPTSLPTRLPRLSNDVTVIFIATAAGISVVTILPIACCLCCLLIACCMFWKRKQKKNKKDEQSPVLVPEEDDRGFGVSSAPNSPHTDENSIFPERDRLKVSNRRFSTLVRAQNSDYDDSISAVAPNVALDEVYLSTESGFLIVTEPIERRPIEKRPLEKINDDSFFSSPFG